MPDHTLTMAAKPSAPRPKSRRSYMRTGVYALRNAVAALPALPGKRTALGRALAEWRDALLADLGGADRVSTQQRALVDLAVRSKLLVDSVDAYVLQMPSPVNRKKRTLHPVVRERQALVGQLQSLLRDLGLERREEDAADVTRTLEALHGKRETPTQTPRGAR